MKKHLGLYAVLTSATLLQGYPALAGTSCESVTLKEKPRWISGAVVARDGPQLIAIDPMQNSVFEYNPDGTRTKVPAEKFQTNSSKSEFQPTSIALHGATEYLIGLAPGSTFMRLGPDLSPRTIPVSLQLKSATTDPQVGALFQWKPAGLSIVGYGSLVKDGEIEMGIVRVPLRPGKNAKPEMLTPINNSDIYMLGTSFVTTIGDTAYYLAMEKEPVIYRARPGEAAQKLGAFPEEFRHRPVFSTRLTGPKAAAALFRELELRTVATGLYSQDGFLYVLGRRPDGDRTAWTLYKIDPTEDRLVWQQGLRLPTQANHLTVAPSESTWYVIERGRVEGDWQSQDISTMLLLDNRAILEGSLSSVCR